MYKVFRFSISIILSSLQILTVSDYTSTKYLHVALEFLFSSQA